MTKWKKFSSRRIVGQGAVSAGWVVTDLMARRPSGRAISEQFDTL
jgi:hypothetical protein